MEFFLIAGAGIAALLLFGMFAVAFGVDSREGFGR